MNCIWIKTLKKTSLLLAVMLLCFVFSCDQDSIFYDISNEPEPKDPLIPGSPTNMVVIKNHLYVGTRFSNKIFCYSTNSGTPEWTTLHLPSGSLGELATDGNDLYILIFPGGDPLKQSTVRRYSLSSNSWDMSYSVNLYSIQTLYGAGGRIFAGGQLNTNRENFAIFYLDNSSESLVVVKYATSLLTGAIYENGNTYLATSGHGMYIFDEKAANVYSVGSDLNANYTGMISIGGIIIAVTADGSIYSMAGGGLNKISTGVNYTGALCVWNDPDNQWRPSLLLMGIRGSGLKHGYQEMILNNGVPTFTIKTPGDESPTSVKNKAKYEASLGTHPVEAILQVPDVSSGGPIYYRDFESNPEWEPPIFASTSKSGLWSYRNGEWNAEE